MARYLVKHVVKETESCRDIGMTVAVKIDAHMDVGFRGLAVNRGTTLAPL